MVLFLEKVVKYLNEKTNDAVLLLNNIGFLLLYFYNNKIEISFINCQKYIKLEYNFDLIMIDDVTFKQLYLESKNVENNDYFNNFHNFVQNKKEYKSLQKNISFINKDLIDYMMNIIENKNKDVNILNPFSRYGCIANSLLNNGYNNIYCYDNNIDKSNIAKSRLQLCHKIDKTKIMTNNIINENIIKTQFDIIICEIPDNVHNIIHAQCNENIKKIKIRGTKIEPLSIQLLTSLLNNDGIAIVIVADSFLFNDSSQHVQTRKYLLDNFNVKEIISLDNKKSILYFDRSDKQNSICFKNYNNNSNSILEKSVLETKNYSLYYNNYIDINQAILNTNTIKFKDIINIESNLNVFNNEYLVCHHNNLFKIINSKDEVYDYIFISKDTNLYLQKFLNYYLKEYLTNNINIITKGKINQLNIGVIYDLEIIKYSIKEQEVYISYFETNKQILKNYSNQIDNYMNLKNNYIRNLIYDSETVKLNTLCTISHESTKKNTISILKNSNNAGFVDLTNTDSSKSTNIYYINNVNKVNEMYLYNILKYNEQIIMNLSNSKNTIILSNKNLENLDIPIISDSKQIKLNECLFYDNEIAKLNELINHTKSIKLV
jgi:hypothetical protein